MGTSENPRVEPVVESRNPATGETWRRFDATTPAAVATAIADARAAQPEWSARSIRERARRLEAFRKELYRRRTEIADTISRENGKPPVEALSEVMVTLDFARYYSRSRTLRALRPKWHTATGPAMWRKRVQITQEPFGVIGVISPWNYPLMLPTSIALPALVAGNAVLLKPSEFTTQTGLLIAELFHEAGIPTSVMRTLPGARDTGAALIEHGCDKIFFTGSEATGRAVASTCGAQLIPCVLELGGSDAAIVLADANLERAADGITWGRFSNSGQTCVAPKRVFVEAPVYDRFSALIAQRVSRLTAGTDRTTNELGPLIRPAQAQLLRSQLDDALAHGARVVATSTGSTDSLPVAVLAGATPEMRVLREETFGPLLPLVSVRNESEAVVMANNSPYGLSASVWTGNDQRALRIASQLAVGSVTINDAITAAGMSDVPHGGIKASGSGRAHGVAGLLECVHTKSVVIERLPRMRQLWWYPYRSGMRDAMDSAVTALHGHGIRARALALWRARSLLRRRRP